MNADSQVELKARLADAGAPGIVLDNVGALDGAHYAMLSEDQRAAVGLLFQRGRKWGVSISLERNERVGTVEPSDTENVGLAISQINGGWAPKPEGKVRLRCAAVHGT